MVSWELIALIVVTVLLLLAGGYIKRLLDELHELISVTKDALEDGQITAKELATIFKEAKDVGNVIYEIAKVISRKYRLEYMHVP